MLVEIVNGEKIDVDDGMNAIDLAKKIHRFAPDQSVAVKVNGTLQDLSLPLKEGDSVEFFDFSDPLGQEVFWHTSAHLLAQAVLRLFPNAKPTIGPPIDHGFYYDFGNLHLSEEDFGRLEKEMQKIVKENHSTEKVDFPDKTAALQAFETNKYKCEIIEEIEEGQPLSGYRQGEFFDLCRGPHLPSLGKIKALKVLKTSGAYWRGDSNNEMLTRIYGITFPSKDLLKNYLHRLEEAKKRDHKILGPKLDLFSLKEEAPGMPFIHPKGMVVWEGLCQFLREKLHAFDYLEIKTPSVMTRGLWEQSGHWFNYRENMYAFEIESRDFAIKPMNCPGCILYYKSHVHSYREFPLRIGEIGNVHRYEPSGALSGLFRVRSFHQDDAHIFMEPHQIKDEILNVIAFADELYKTFGLTYSLELSTRPEENTIGSDEEWELSTKALRQALEETKLPFKVNEGDGAFYGPKIDFHIHDALGRSWQCGTVQLDMALPQKFDLEYTAADGVRKRPIMIHRALFGSIERFFGILIEHFAGKFPLWLSPNQIIVVPVADRHVETGKKTVDILKKSGYLASIDDSSESVSKKVRNAQLKKINYLLTVGDKEVENHSVSVRTRDGVVHGETSLETFIEKLDQEKQGKYLEPKV